MRAGKHGSISVLAVFVIGPLFMSMPEMPRSMPAMAEVASAVPGTVECFDYSGMKGGEEKPPEGQLLWAAKAGRGWLVLHSDLSGIGLQYSREE